MGKRKGEMNETQSITPLDFRYFLFQLSHFLFFQRVSMMGGQVTRLISTARLHTLRYFHLLPINLVVFKEPLGDTNATHVTRLATYDIRHTSGIHGKISFGGGFPLICFQRLSRPDIATRPLHLAAQPVHQRSVQLGPLVL